MHICKKKINKDASLAHYVDMPGLSLSLVRVTEMMGMVALLAANSSSSTMVPICGLLALQEHSPRQGKQQHHSTVYSRTQNCFNSCFIRFDCNPMPHPRPRPLPVQLVSVLGGAPPARRAGVPPPSAAAAVDGDEPDALLALEVGQDEVDGGGLALQQAEATVAGLPALPGQTDLLALSGEEDVIFLKILFGGSPSSPKYR